MPEAQNSGTEKMPIQSSPSAQGMGLFYSVSLENGSKNGIIALLPLRMEAEPRAQTVRKGRMNVFLRRRSEQQTVANRRGARHDHGF